jgi:hypothetical protein
VAFIETGNRTGFGALSQLFARWGYSMSVVHCLGEPVSLLNLLADQKHFFGQPELFIAEDNLDIERYQTFISVLPGILL